MASTLEKLFSSEQIAPVHSKSRGEGGANLSVSISSAGSRMVGPDRAGI
jgi:hypothetical protein